MPAGRDALFGAEILATDKIMADPAYPMAAENQRGFVGGRLAEFSGFAQIAQVDKWAVEQVVDLCMAAAVDEEVVVARWPSWGLSE